MRPALEIRQVHKRFGTLRALDGIDLEVGQGDFLALLGPNGAGKTTLISIVAGLALADGGNVRVMGCDVVADYRDARRMLGVVPQELVFDPFFTVRETLMFQSGYYGLKRNGGWIDEILHHLDLADRADANMRSLSGGMKRRVLVAQALVHKPPVVVLDEPTAGVDVEMRQALWHFITRLNRNGHTIVLTTHYLEEAEALCNRVAILQAGRIVALDSMRNLVRGLAGCRIRLRLSPDALPPSLQPLAAAGEDGVHTLALETYAQIEQVMATLRQSGTEILDLHVTQQGLEDVFVSLTSRPRRPQSTPAPASQPTDA